MSAPDLTTLSDRELIVDLDRVEQQILSTRTYVPDRTQAASPVSPELLALAEREEAITTELRRRRWQAQAAYAAVTGRSVDPPGDR